MSQGDAESRFSHLLQPIRDLTKNWDVDIASQLEEYLEEVEKITVTFDGGETTMNFAEAALLIQGSACVYSRKVEYLYGLVYQVLDLLASKKKLQQAGSVDAEGNDKDATFVNKNKDQDTEYLTLDDISEQKNIDKLYDDTTHTVQTVPRTPMALVKVDEVDKGENPLLSRKGEILGSRKDFKMNTCNASHVSGTMLLDLSHLSLLEMSLAAKPSSTPFMVARAMARTEQNEGVEKMAVEEENNVLQDSCISLGDGDGPLDLPDMDEDPLPPQDGTDHDEPEQKDKMELRPRTPKVHFAMPEKPKVDVWAPLDPHEVGTINDKPFKRGRTFRLPTSLESDTGKSRKRKKAPEPKKIQPISEFIAANFHSCAYLYPSNKLKVPDFPEFEPQYWMEFKRRQNKLKQERKLMLQHGQYQDLVEEDQEKLENDNHQGDGGVLGGADDDDDDDQAVDFNLPMGAPDMIEDVARTIEDNMPAFTTPMDEDQSDAPIVNSYEELVRHHVEGFLASAQEYAQVTELSKRVAEWEDKILPRLQEEEEHEPYDIHLYGTRVLDSVEERTDRIKKVSKDKAVKIPFKKVVENKEPFQVCRMFLATLQLANNYNVEISSDGPLEVGVDTMALTLLNRKRHFEELQEYRAPSVET